MLEQAHTLIDKSRRIIAMDDWSNQRPKTVWMDATLALAEALTKIRALEAALLDAGHYVACCPPPPEATGDLRISLLEERTRIAQAVPSMTQHADAPSALPTGSTRDDG